MGVCQAVERNAAVTTQSISAGTQCLVEYWFNQCIESKDDKLRI
jgi:hypothetical protein